MLSFLIIENSVKLVEMFSIFDFWDNVSKIPLIGDDSRMLFISLSKFVFHHHIVCDCLFNKSMKSLVPDSKNSTGAIYLFINKNVSHSMD